MPPHYDPPYDSPIEDKFTQHYVKHANDVVVILITPGGYRVGIECDGKEFHEPSRDEWRDAMILGGNHLDALYRIRGSDITYHLDDLLYLLSVLEPSIFSERATSNLKVLASREIQKIDMRHDIDNYQVTYDGRDFVGTIHIEARRQQVPGGQRRFGKLRTNTPSSLELVSLMPSLPTIERKARRKISSTVNTCLC
jgi:hypothetical protein